MGVRGVRGRLPGSVEPERQDAVDRLVSAEAIRDAARWIPGAELKMYPDAAHEILREADPVRADALATIDEFLTRRAR